MAKLSKVLTAACATACTMAAFPVQAAITIDGGLGDWGVSVADGNLSDWNGALPGRGDMAGASLRVVGGTTIYTNTEDQDDHAGDGGFLGPNHGGQNYDVEFLGVGVRGGNLFIAIATGQRPDNGFSRYSPGDIRIDTAGGVYGVEVGGGAGGGAGGAIGVGAPGSTYGLNSSGYTTSHSPSGVFTAGSVWKTPGAGDWINDPIPPPTPVQLNHGPGTTSTLAGTASNFIYTRDSLTSQHAVIELKIPLSVFLFASIKQVTWAPSCGNDVLDVILPGTGIVTPAPATLPLFLLGLGGLGLRRLRRRAA